MWKTLLRRFTRVIHFLPPLRWNFTPWLPTMTQWQLWKEKRLSRLIFYIWRLQNYARFHWNDRLDNREGRDRRWPDPSSPSVTRVSSWRAGATLGRYLFTITMEKKSSKALNLASSKFKRSEEYSFFTPTEYEAIAPWRISGCWCGANHFHRNIN